MANSTTILADLGTVITNGPSATTKANAIAPAGSIMDYVGNTQLALLKAQELKVLLTAIVSDTDAGSDATNLGLLNGVLNDLV